ncbi:metalloregulator ArsR/SmtB family transcription factor [bacterium]|nr:metalloregulator ArsR/SmtB family transcription factor [bacterium]
MSRRPDRAPSARDLTELFRTLSDETRFRLLRLLSRQELTVNELSTITQLAQPRISNHLKILREEKLIVERRAGSWRHYRVDQDQLPGAVVGCWPLLEAAWKDNDQFAADDKRLALVMEERGREGVGSFFDQLAHRWDDLRATLFGDAIGRGILQAFIPLGLVVADVGTGTGYMLELFGKRASRLIAIDHSEIMLGLARQKLEAAGLDNVDYRLADVQDSAPLKPGESDLVTMVQVLHHLDRPERAVSSLATGIKPGGVLILSDFVEHQESWLRDQLHHRWLGFGQKKVADWMLAAGLTLESWEVLPGRRFEADDGEWMTIPDSFIAVGRR